MIQKFGDCKGECQRKGVPINSKGLCPDCQYIKTHGKSKQEVYFERSKGKVKEYVKKLPNTTKKHRKTMVNSLLKNERLEKRREQIRKDEETYEQVFNSKPNICEECGTPLPDIFRDYEGNIVYRSQYSHIMTKAAFPEFRNDSRNFNRLCYVHHDQWEFHDRENMKIFNENKKIINTLISERNGK